MEEMYVEQAIQPYYIHIEPKLVAECVFKREMALLWKKLFFNHVIITHFFSLFLLLMVFARIDDDNNWVLCVAKKQNAHKTGHQETIFISLKPFSFVLLLMQWKINSKHRSIFIFLLFFYIVLFLVFWVGGF